MKNVLKIIGKILKWYMIFDEICLAFIGTGQLLKEYRKHPEKGVLEINGIVLEKSLNQKVDEVYIYSTYLGEAVSII